MMLKIHRKRPQAPSLNYLRPASSRPGPLQWTYISETLHLLLRGPWVLRAPALVTGMERQQTGQRAREGKDGLTELASASEDEDGSSLD